MLYNIIPTIERFRGAAQNGSKCENECAGEWNDEGSMRVWNVSTKVK